MDDNRQPVRFGLKTLLLAMLTCGVAFGVLSWQQTASVPSWRLAVFGLALCVPGFWIGMALAFVSTVIPGRSSVVEFVRVVFFGCGLVLAQSWLAIAIGLIVVVVVSLSVSATSLIK